MPGKLLVIHSSNEMFGSDQVLLRTVLALRTQGWQPLVLLPDDLAYTGELGRELEKNQVPVRVMALGILRRSYLRPDRAPAYLAAFLRAVWRVRAIIREEKIRVVYSATGAVLCGAFAAALARVPHVWHIHEIPLRPRMMVKALSWIYAAFAVKIIAVSQAVKDHWAGFNSNLGRTMTVIHNGVDVGYYAASGRREALRRAMGLQPGEVVVGCLGRIGTWKGQEVLLQALQLLQMENLPIRGLIAGGTVPGAEDKLRVLRELIQTLNLESCVLLQAFQQDVRPILEVLDIVAVPSVKPEPFGMVILESMAFGRPVLATNIGGSPEVVQNGETGYLVAPGDPQALAGAIRTLAADPEQRVAFGLAGRRRVAEHFSLQTYQQKIIGLFSDLPGIRS